MNVLTKSVAFAKKLDAAAFACSAFCFASFFTNSADCDADVEAFVDDDDDSEEEEEEEDAEDAASSLPSGLADCC